MKKFNIFLIVTTCLSLATAVFLLANSALGAERLTRAEPIVRMVLQEANNEPFDGMVVVAGTVVDRVSDPRWPDTDHGVVYQPYQYTGMSLRLGTYTFIQIERARQAVRLARLGIRPCGRSVFWYHTLDAEPAWDRHMEIACEIGNHVFFREQ